MKSTLAPGVSLTFRYRVPETKTVPHVFPESARFAKDASEGRGEARTGSRTPGVSTRRPSARSAGR